MNDMVPILEAWSLVGETGVTEKLQLSHYTK